MALSTAQQEEVLQVMGQISKYRNLSDGREAEMVRLLLQKTELLLGVLARLRDPGIPDPDIDDLIVIVRKQMDDTRRREVLRHAIEKQEQEQEQV